MSDVPAVDAVDLTKTFGPLTAVDNISLRVAQGEVYGLTRPASATCALWSDASPAAA